MKFVDEYRDGDIAQKYLRAIADITTQNWNIMEVCGGQTHAIVRSGINDMLPKNINLMHGPGCPVCVTSLEKIERAIEIASKENVIFCSFGDMLRVPASAKDLLSVKAQGGDVRVIYSPLDSVKIAAENSDKKVVFFAIGFETTAPANAMAIKMAADKGLDNFYALISHVLVPPAIEVILSSESNKVDGFLAAGHVCTIEGYEQYHPLATKYKTPIVVTGFEPVDILQGLYMCVKQLEEGRAEVENQYARSVVSEGNLHAQKLVSEVFEIDNQKWRGIGEIKNSGLKLAEKYQKFDAEKEFDINLGEILEPENCISGLILQGLKKPHECPSFGKNCTPEKPLGATMVSGEGACSAYYNVVGQ